MVLKKFKLVLFLVPFVFLSFDTPVFASVFYKFDVVAQPGDFSNGIKDTVSINDKGMVAFVGVKSGPVMEDVYIGDGLKPFTVLSSQQVGPRYASGVQINNSNQVVVRHSVGLNSAIRVYDGNNPGDFITVVRGDGTGQGGTTLFPAAFDAVFSHPSLSNQGKGISTPYVVFSALETGSSDTVLSTPIVYGETKKANFNKTEKLQIPLRPMIADDGRIVVRGGINGTDQDPILVYSNDFQQKTTIASTGSSFTKLGRSPGISDDGTVVAFAGEAGKGQGVFISIDEGSGFGTPFVIAGEDRKSTAELGYDANAQPLFLGSFDLDSRVGVVRLDLGDSGFRDDVVVVSFVATPNNASISNPSTGKPLTFSQEKGIWTVRIDFDRPLSSGSPGFNKHINSPIPVVQVGDQIQTSSSSFTVNDLAVYDPLALAAEDTGGIRTQRRGDHRVAFWASNGTDQIVVRAGHLDSDQDGLLDHWESGGGGIDVDQDGTIDLDLSALGATTTKRDLFLEIDWLKGRTSGFVLPYSNEPAPGVTKYLAANIFTTAPALTGTRYGVKSDGTTPDDIPAGIVAHIDAGAGKDMLGDDFSIGMPANLQGGDEISMGGSHIDVVYFDKSTTLLNGYGVLKARSFHEIKDVYFGTTDKRAREFAFHYTVLADFYEILPTNNSPFTGTVAAATSSDLTVAGSPFSVSLAGNAVMIISSGNSSDGQIRTIVSNTANTLTISGNWSPIPDVGSQFILLSGSSGLAEMGSREGVNTSDFWTRPGNDFMMTLGGFGATSTKSGNYLGEATEQIGTLLHEFGHTNSLRHGGIDHTHYKSNYWSLMNYAYQFGACTDGTTITICMNGGNCYPLGKKIKTCNKFFLDYSRPGDPIFIDWENLRMDVFNTGFHIGNTFGLDALGSPPPEIEEMNVAEVEKLFGPRDLVAPEVVINAPKPGASILKTFDLIVNVDATDNVEIDDVMISFDIDGDDSLDGPGEVISAINTIGDTYEATFKNIYGPDGQRTIKVVAKDLVMNPGIAYGTVTVTASLGGTVTPVITPTPSPLPTLTTTPTAVPTPTPLVTLTPEITPTPQATPTPVPTVEPTPTHVPTPTLYPTPRITPSPAPTGTPTAVTLLYFKAKAGDKGNVALTWRTATEVNNAGFNLYRARRKNGAYTKINDTLIPPQGNAVSGASYSYVDKPGKGNFYYKLEDVDKNGVSAMHGPEKAKVRTEKNASRRSR